MRFSGNMGGCENFEFRSHHRISLELVRLLHDDSQFAAVIPQR
jgi:hypothetical protein